MISFNKTNKKHHLSYFSFIELLVVISIFTILISLLQPALSKVITASRSLECTKNLSMIYFGMNEIALNENDKWPIRGHYNPTTNAWHVPSFWAKQLFHSGMLEKEDSIFCPSEINHHPLGDYGPNDYISVLSRAETIQSHHRVGNNDISNPAQKVLMIDSKASPTRGSWYFGSRGWVSNPNNITAGYLKPPRHAELMNSIFCDGHTEGLDPITLVNERKSLFEFYK